MDGTMSISVTITCSYSELGNLIETALRGGSNYWCVIEDYKDPKKWDWTDGAGETEKYSYTYPFNDGGAIVLRDEEDTETSEEGKVYKLDFKAVQRGLRAFAASKEYAHHWSDFMKDNADQITGDVFLQFCLFGEVKYS